jgi:hypothetical protein
MYMAKRVATTDWVANRPSARCFNMMRTRQAMDDWSKVRLGNYEIIINKRRNAQYVEGQKSATSRKQSTEDHKKEKEKEKKRRKNGRVYSPPECVDIKTCSRE